MMMMTVRAAGTRMRGSFSLTGCGQASTIIAQDYVNVCNKFRYLGTGAGQPCTLHGRGAGKHPLLTPRGRSLMSR
jgi:hypothetical protein